MGGQRYREGHQHPEEYRRDLNPEAAANERAERDSPSAYDLKALHRRLADYPDDVLKQIQVLPAGTRLSQGSTYIDLREPSPREFTATAQTVAGPENWYVDKSEVDYRIWNALIGVEESERL